jgi:SAM-dependent methyltransferase
LSDGWKDALLAPASGGELPEGYRRQGEILGRDEFLDESGGQLWSDSRFAARAQTPHTTSEVEARIRRRHLERLLDAFEIDRAAPTLDLGCADGTLAHDLLEFGFEQLVSTDILHETVAILDGSLDDAVRDRVMLVVDDMLRLPFESASFGTVIAWGILSLTDDFDRSLERSWGWVRPGGYLLVAEPLLEQALVYPLVRGDLEEFRRVQDERSRASMWDRRDQRYEISPRAFYEERLPRLPEAKVVDAGGINMLASLVLGGSIQEKPVTDEERADLAERTADPGLDEVGIWRQAFWLLHKG